MQLWVKTPTNAYLSWKNSCIIIYLAGFKNPLRAYLSDDARQAAAVYRKSSWRVFVAVSLERRPTITKEKTSLEKKFEIFQNSLEIEHSALSDYEFKRNQNKKGAQTTGKKKLTEADEQKRLEFERDFARIEVLFPLVLGDK